MENTASGQSTEESEETNLDPLTVVQLRDGSDLARNGSMDLENSALGHRKVWKEKRHHLLMH